MKNLKQYIEEKLIVNKNYSVDNTLTDLLNEYDWKPATYSGNSSMNIRNTFLIHKDITEKLIDAIKEIPMCKDKNHRVIVRYVIPLKSIRIDRICDDNTMDRITICTGMKYTDAEYDTFISFNNYQKKDSIGTDINFISETDFDAVIEKFDFKK